MFRERGFIHENVSGHRYCGVLTEKIPRKIGIVRLIVITSNCHPGGRIRFFVRFGTTLDVPRLTIIRRMEYAVKGQSKKGKSRKTSPNSRMRSVTATTIFRSKPIIEGLFYSHAMKCWRVQYREVGLTFDTSRESSLCFAFRPSIPQHDYERYIAHIGESVPRITTWKEWQEFTKFVCENMRDACEFCYVC